MCSFVHVNQVAQARVLLKCERSHAFSEERIGSKLASDKSANNACYFDHAIDREKLDQMHFQSLLYLSNGSTGSASYSLFVFSS